MSTIFMIMPFLSNLNCWGRSWLLIFGQFATSIKTQSQNISSTFNEKKSIFRFWVLMNTKSKRICYQYIDT